jgi:hypothetical protein
VARFNHHNSDASRSTSSDGGSGIVVGNDGCLEPTVVVDVLENFNPGFGAQPIPDRVRALLLSENPPRRIASRS